MWCRDDCDEGERSWVPGVGGRCICMGETLRKERAVIRFSIEFRPCGMSVCRVLIQKASRSGRASGSQCSNGTILWSLRKYRGIRLFVSEVSMCTKVYCWKLGLCTAYHICYK